MKLDTAREQLSQVAKRRKNIAAERKQNQERLLEMRRQRVEALLCAGPCSKYRGMAVNNTDKILSNLELSGSEREN